MIRKSGKKWCLYAKKKDKSGKRRKLGCYSSKKGAENREKQVKMFKHLKEQNLTYFEHFIRANKITLKLFKASSLCFLHSVLPFLFTTSATDICKEVIIEYGLYSKPFSHK